MLRLIHFAAIVWGYFGTGIRLRKASNIRNHQSPVDFISDRFQSQFLRYTIVILQVVPAVIYLAAQVAAIKVRVLFDTMPVDSNVSHGSKQIDSLLIGNI